MPRVHIDWKAIAGTVGFIAGLVVQVVPGLLANPHLSPKVVSDLAIALQVCSGTLLLLGRFKLLPPDEAAVAQEVAGQQNARPPAPAPTTLSSPTEEGK